MADNLREGLVLSIRTVAHLTERIGIIVVALVKRVVCNLPTIPSRYICAHSFSRLASEASGLCAGMARIS